MKSESAINPHLSPVPRQGIIRRAIQVLIMFLFIAASLFIPAGSLGWVWGWVYLGLYVVGITASAVFLFRISPGTIARRAESEGMKDWDKVVGGFWSVLYFVGTPVVAGLDWRFGWAGSVDLIVHIAGGVAFAAGFALFIWAMVTNAFFSTVSRVQEEQGQRVCRSGPYSVVRHPGYLGAVGQSLATPLVLGSAWALIPGTVAAVLMVIRTALEDRDLRRELRGYKAYAKRVRHRLIPGIW